MQLTPHEWEAVLAGSRALVGIAARSLGTVSEEVSLPQYRLLVLLEGRGRQTMKELAASLDVNPSTVTRACDLLVDKDLIRRVAHPGDRRTVCAELAPRGRKMVAAVMRRRRRLIDAAIGRMAAPDRRRLASSLAAFAEAAGEVSDHAWTLGWDLEGETGGGGG